jgi:hypothetical protein
MQITLRTAARPQVIGFSASVLAQHSLNYCIRGVTEGPLEEVLHVEGRFHLPGEDRVVAFLSLGDSH